MLVLAASSPPVTMIDPSPSAEMPVLPQAIEHPERCSESAERRCSKVYCWPKG